ncbi:hypothetical protein MLD38_003939 [Melastoma candidum]|uniref:Uncharacterized protein n=1 Tax=Melastoma candidum TaxID=119954 RepID=A0ACB9S4U6_9MYRT|nr:hypothetical protein MLD38_003939 [Melastoma candidum]
MRMLRLMDRFRSTQVHALLPSDESPNDHRHPLLLKLLFFPRPTPTPTPTPTPSLSHSLILAYGLPTLDLIEPPIQPHLNPLHLVDSLSLVYRLLHSSPPSQKPLLYLQLHALLRCLGDPKLLRRCLRSALQSSLDFHSHIVLTSWLTYDSPHHHPPFDFSNPHPHPPSTFPTLTTFTSNDLPDTVIFCIDDQEVQCVRTKLASLSIPFSTMLYGGFAESATTRVDFSLNGISVEGMRALEAYSRTRRLDLFSPQVVLELLSFSNAYCCEQMKADCDAYLSSLPCNIDDAVVLVEFGLEESAHHLVASCLRLLLSKLPGILHNPAAMKIFCSSEARERLAAVGHASFMLYYFLSQVAMEENMVSHITVMLLERLGECAKESWQKALSMHQLGCVMLERKNFKDAQLFFEAAAEAGHVYSVAGVARAKYKLGQQYSAYLLINSLISKHKTVGWMFQERSLYGMGEQKLKDVNTATELDPTLSFPYKYRALVKVEEKRIKAAVSEIDKFIGFKFLPECLELRAWLSIALEDYEGALRDVRALLTLKPDYLLFNGRVRGSQLVDLLGQQIQQRSQADCWMQLYDRWSSVDDIGSLAVIHQMLDNEPTKSLLWFRQSLLLLRLNSQKAAMRSLRMARNHSYSEHERLVYEGWILYDTGNSEEALSMAEKSIAIQRSFEAFFLKAYVLADASLDFRASSYVIQLLEEALKCPSDGLRKGQALNNLASIYVDSGNLDLAATCYTSALAIKHTRAHQGLARVFYLKNQRKAAYDEMTQLIEKAQYKASAYEKRSEYCDREMAQNDLNMATRLDPLRTYPYRYRAAVLMDEQKEIEAVEELTRAISFRPDLHMLHLRAAFYESMMDFESAVRDCEAALCLEPTHLDTIDLCRRAQERGKLQVT